MLRRLLPLLCLPLLACPPAVEGELSVRFERAIGGALWANPAVYTQLPIEMAVEGDGSCTEDLVLMLDGVDAGALEQIDPQHWDALLDLEALDAIPEAGARASLELALWCGERESLGSVRLELGDQGIQFTNMDDNGAATTPRLLWSGGRLFVSWCDWLEENRQCWFQEIDGAGGTLGDRIRLGNAEDSVLNARLMVAEGIVAAILQGPGSPYAASFKLMDLEGNALFGPEPLDEAGWSSHFGGDLVYRDGVFSMAWRSWNNEGAGDDLKWMSIDAQSYERVGPLTLTSSGDGSTTGQLALFGFVKIEAGADWNTVTFVRQFFHIPLDMMVPKAQYARIAPDGTLLGEGYLGGGLSFDWDWEAHLHRAGGETLALWTSDDLADPTEPSPTRILGKKLNGEGIPMGDVFSLVAAPDYRSEPFFFEHPDPSYLGYLAWADSRNYEVNAPAKDLRVAAMNEDHTLEPERIFEHAMFFDGLGQLSGVTTGQNSMMIWRDPRKGNFGDSEIFMDWVWGGAP